MADEQNMSLRESIEAAGKEQGVTETPETETTETPETPVETKSEEKSSESEIDPEIEEAINFYKALKDPNQQRGIVEELARRTGLLKPSEELTPKAEKKYTELIKDVLGTEYPDLEQRLSTVLSAMERESNNKIQALQNEIIKERQQKAVQEFDKEFSGFIKEHKVSEEIATKMIKEIELLPPNMQGKMTLTQYMAKIHSLATMNQKQVDDAVKRNQKIEQNLKTRPTNLTGDISEDRLKKGSKLPSIRESVQAAAQGIAFDE